MIIKHAGLVEKLSIMINLKLQGSMNTYEDPFKIDKGFVCDQIVVNYCVGELRHIMSCIALSR